MTVDVLARLRSARERANEVSELLARLTAASRRESGCVEYRAFTSVEGDGVEFLVRESYVDQSALDAHRRSEHYLTLVPIVIQALCEPIEVHSLSPVTIPLQAVQPSPAHKKSEGS